MKFGARLASGGQEVGHVDELGLWLGHAHLLTHRAYLCRCERLELLLRLPDVGDAEAAADSRYPVEKDSLDLDGGRQGWRP